MDFDKVVEKRHSVRSFKKTKKVDYRDVVLAVEAATKAPLAGNIFGVKFVIVTDKEKIKELSEACVQDFVSDVDYVVAVCSVKKDLIRNYNDRGEKYMQQEIGAAVENFLLKIIDLGLASCWVGAFSDLSVKDILKVPDGVEVEALLPVGYELGKTEQKTKPNLDDVLFFDKWKNRFFGGRRMVAGSET